MTAEQMTRIMHVLGVNNWSDWSEAGTLSRGTFDDCVEEVRYEKARVQHYHYDVLQDGNVIAMFPWTPEDWKRGLYART